jgi:hypothetical protein
MGYVRETGLERDVDDLAAGLPLVAKKLEGSGQAPLENAPHCVQDPFCGALTAGFFGPPLNLFAANSV